MFGKLGTLYEVHVRREGRWRIEASYTDEEGALSSARVQLVGRGAEEVKVLKQRNLAGLSLETVIFQKKAPEVKQKPLGLGGSAEGAPYCRSLGDLYGFESRVVIGRLLGPFLDKYRITATELLHSWTYARKLDEQSSLIGAAIHAAARHHAETHGAAVPARVKELRALVDRAMGRTRDFLAERKRLPAFDLANLAASSREIDYAVGEAEHDFIFLSQLCLHLADRSSLVGKLEALLDLLHDESEPRHFALIDGVMADALGSVEVIKELLGAQNSLAMGLCVLADHLYGRDPDPQAEPASPLLARVCDLGLHGRAPQCRAVLVDRLRRSLNGDQPLDRRDPKAEAHLVELVTTHLKGADGQLLGGQDTAKALGRRLVRHRQTLLREQGMHDIADRLSGR